MVAGALVAKRYVCMYVLHTSDAWMIGHNISIEESQGRFVR